MSTPIPAELADFAKHYSLYKGITLIEKIAFIIDCIQRASSIKEVYTEMKSAMSYPFLYGDYGEGDDLCLNQGTVKMKNGTRLRWQIWKREHEITFHVFN